jgi:hypothetical protein
MRSPPPSVVAKEAWPIRDSIGKGLFNPEPTATVFFLRFAAAVAVGSGLNERKTDWP